MHEYVSFLRGVNVGGKVLKMDGLVKLYRDLGLSDVRSYIQSGNILFNVNAVRREGLEGELRRQIGDRLSFDVSVLIRSRGQLRGIVEANPFVGRAGVEHKSLYVTLLEAPIDKARAKALPHEEGTADEYAPAVSEIYLHCPGGYGKTVYSNAYFEKHLGMRATTRNWNTMARLLAMAEAPGAS
jgi:uncharacterized protein (DUF1697 family)